MAELQMGGMTRNQALVAIAEAYNSPVSLHYLDEEVILVPEMVDLALDVEATGANLDEVLIARSGLRGFVRYALDQILRREPPPLAVQPVFDYSRERLDAFLERIVKQYDHEPLPPVVFPEMGTFQPSQRGTALNVEASRPLVVKALLSAVEREVKLVVAVTPAPEATLDVLEQAIEGQLLDFTGIVGVFVKDTETGQELCLNCNVAFTALSTLKLAIAGELYRTAELASDQDSAFLASQMLTEQDDTMANFLLARLGSNDPYVGAQRVTAFMQSLGFVNSFIVAPYTPDENPDLASLVTPANSRTDINTVPSPYYQTTPMEMGLLLEGFYQCGQGGGLLRVLYAQQIAPAECEDTLAWLSQNTANRAIAAGMPPETRLAHMYGWGGHTFANLTLVYSPETDFVIAVFIHQPEWEIPGDSAAAFEVIGQLAYRFFNPESVEPTDE